MVRVVVVFSRGYSHDTEATHICFLYCLVMKCKHKIQKLKHESSEVRVFTKTFTLS